MYRMPIAAAVSRKSMHAMFVRAGHEAVVVMQHRGNDAGGAIGRRGDDAATGGVFLVHRERVEIDPVEDRQRIAQRRFRPIAQFRVHARRAALHLEAARQHAGFAHAACDAILHRLPDRQQAAADFRLAAPDLFVFEHQLRDALACLVAQREQFVAAVERVGQRCRVRHDLVVGRFVVIDHEAAADRVVVARRQFLAVCVEGAEAHAVGVIRQLLALVEHADRFSRRMRFRACRAGAVSSRCGCV